MLKLIVGLLSFFLLWAQTTVVVAQTKTAGPQSKSYSETLSDIDAFLALLESIKGELDRSQFEIDALLDSLDYDADKIVRFLQEQIYFEQYEGLLRGAEGTLLSRAGNALDQAVLLARLLKDAGYDARIFSARLSDPDAHMLLQELAVPRKPEPPIGNTRKIKELLLEFGEENGVPADSITNLDFSNAMKNPEPRRDLLESVKSQSGFLIEKLLDSGFQFAPKHPERSLVQEAKDYYAVEYRAGTGTEWKAVHPALRPRFEFSESATPVEYFAREIPSELQHRFRFEAFLTQRAGEELIDKPIVPAWERPAANLVGKTLTFTTSSANLAGATQDLEFDLQNVPNDVFFPQFNGVSGDLAFDLRGNVVPAAEAGSMYAGVFEAISQQTNRAGAALANLGNAEQKKHLTELASLKVKYALIAPDGTKREFERTVYDSAKVPDSGDAAYIQKLKDLTTVYSIDVRGARASPAYLANQFLEGLLELETQLRMKAAAEFGRSDDFDDLKRHTDKLSIAWQYHGLQHSMFASFFEAKDGVAGYYSAPAVSVHHRAMPLDRRYSEAYDIVSLPIRSVNLESLETTPQQTLEAGVWATLSEGKMLNAPVSGAVGIEEIFNSQTQDGRRVETILPDEAASKLRTLGLAEDVKRLVAEDLNKGYAVVLVHEGVESNIQNTAWWRVDPVTGESTGMLANGEGSKIVDYLVELSVGKMVAIAVAWLVIGIHVAVWCVAAKSVQPGNMTPDDVSWCEEFGDAIASGSVALYALASGGATAIVAAIGAIGKALDL